MGLRVYAFSKEFVTGATKPKRALPLVNIHGACYTADSRGASLVASTTALITELATLVVRKVRHDD